MIAALSITILDGFDAFSLSLVAPRIASNLHIPMHAFGPIFASTIAGMIVGGVFGGWAADRFGRMGVLLLALLLFGLAALTMPLVSSPLQIMIDRFLSGMGLAAAAPIALGLLSRTSVESPSDLAIAIVWSGIPLGGVIAAGFDYLVSGGQGWSTIFIVGGLLPIPVAILAYLVFGGRIRSESSAGVKVKPRFADLFVAGLRPRTIAGAAMFFFGYVMTSIFISWLPTILAHRHASAGLIFLAFMGINIGGVVGALALGWIASLMRSAFTVAAAWAVAGLFGLTIGLPNLSNILVVWLAIAGYAVAAGSQALSVSFATQLHRARNLETTSIGFMTSAGRCGQVCTLSASGALLGSGLPETSLLFFAGASALIGATVGLFAARKPAGSTV